MRRLKLPFRSAQKSAGKSEAMPQQKRRLPLRRLFVGGALLFTLSVGTGLYLERDAFKAELLALSAEAGLQVEFIDIIGRNHTSDTALLSALKIQKGMPILDLDLQALQNAVETIGWVRAARIERHLPQKLRVILDERRPMALHQRDSGHVLIDRTGAVIAGADPSKFAHLPVVSGQNAPEQAARLLDALKTEPELYSDVWAIQLVSGRRWDVHLRSGIAIRLPERDPGLAWSRLARIEQSSNITARDVSAIDLRIPDQLIVEPNIPVSGAGQKT